MTHNIRRIFNAIGVVGLSGLCASVAAPAFAEPDLGSYLATRQAVIQNDFPSLALYAERALSKDPQNLELLESLISALISAGEFEKAGVYATVVQSVEPNNQLGAMARVTLLARNADYDGLLAALENGVSVSELVDKMILAWAYVGAGDIGRAIESFDAASKKGQGFDALGPFNKSLALALVGDFEGAAALMEKAGGFGSRTALIAQVQILSQLERNEDALNILDERVGPTLDPEFVALRDSLQKGKRISFDVVKDARDAIGEVFFSVASALDGGLEDRFTLLYARMAQGVNPEQADYTLFSADLLERLENYDLATQVYEAIESNDPAYPLAELGRAEALRKSGKEDAELEVLKQLTKTHSDAREAHVAYADALRRAQDYEKSVAAYSEAIDLADPSAASSWPLFFTRGIAYERLGEWDKAEPDFRKALELEPGQPQVLNYLGYSFLEMKENYEEAMAMIEAAAEARPDSGYITDSLAWGLFLIGRYEEAVVPMEKAAALLPVDPIINDHLGDVYWAVGRTREAQFQWQRALSFDPEEDELTRIRRKLDVGLDAVLIEEGEEPTRPVSGQ